MKWVERLWWVATVFVFWLDGWATSANLNDRLRECRGDVAISEQRAQQLLSGGRFVRRYNPATGHSVYTFVTTKETP